MIIQNPEPVLADYEIERTVVAMMAMNKTSCLKASTILMDADFTDATMRTAFLELKEHRQKENQERQTAMIMRIRKAATNPSQAVAMLSKALIDNDHLRSTTYGLEIYIDRLVNLSMRRAMCLMADKMTKAAENLDDGYVDVMREQYDAIMARSTIVSDLPALGDILIARLDDMTTEKKQVTRIMTGIRKIDHEVGGFEPGEMIAIAGQPGVGKSAMAMQVAIAAASSGKAVSYFTLELSKEQLADRMFSNVANVPFKHVLDATMTREERGQLVVAANEMASWKFAINDLGTANLATIRALAERQQNEIGLDLLVIDYLQLVDVGTSKNANRTELITNLSRKVKAMAKDMKVAVMILCQLNREGEQDADPTLAQIRESGAMGQDCDMALILSKRDSEPGEVLVGKSVAVKANIAKNRRGIAGKVNIVFDGSYQRFSDSTIDPENNVFNDFDNDDNGGFE